MPECPIPVLFRLENNFYEINVKLNLKQQQQQKKQEGRRSIYIQTHLGKKCFCRDKYYVESRTKCNVNKTLQSALAHKVQMFRDLIALKVVQLAKMRSKRSLLKYFIHFGLISNITIC